METLGEFVRRRRTELGYTTQTSFADATGIKRAHLSQIESGKISLPNADLRRRLAHGLGISHIEILVAAGELGRDEAEVPKVTNSQAVLRLQPLIDQIRWNEQLTKGVEAHLRWIRDLQQGIYWNVELSDQVDNTADMTPEDVRRRREAAKRPGSQ